MTRAALRSLIRARLMPLIVAVALLMETLDANVISTSLPQIARDLGTSPIHLKLALTSYMLALAIFIPASGWAADRFGARPIFRLAIGVFAAGSIACGAADTLAGLVAARVLQGIGGSMMVPVGRLIVLRTTPRAELVNALAWLTVPALIGPVLGPLLGGFITTYWDWRWIFWINLPIAALGLVLVTLFVPQITAETRRRFDLRGFLLLGPGLGTLLTGVTLAGLDLSVPLLIAGFTLGGIALVAAYVVHAGRVEEPLVDLGLLRIPTFRIAALGGTLFRIGAGARPFLLPLLFQLGFAMTPFQSGALTFASGLGAMTMKFVAKPILDRFGFRRVLLANAVISSALMLLPIAFTATTPWVLIVVPLFVAGVGWSLQFTAINAIAYAEVPAERMSSATSFTSVLQQLSGSIGITLAAFGLTGTQRLSGHAVLEAPDFAPVFGMVAAVAMLSAPIFARLARDAGGGMLRVRR
ncbi:DHA2 family efflux MFS transporter permease subunit [Rhodobacter maris]|uniref:EmrB/QacA subfamily drug resistance transporter n=1 Tax=Rhodobacter maris TaxID=446682 RepID=A0A285SDD4_9RHOB|nr:DHA2 family efflux MFS transporter permease subunit [Rhodobacter maris]SOC05186.1 EmrB/QacA subfamily drug resistance transporter [Rhodobacter maris]